MISPQQQRLDYGEQLSPPPGYQLDAAIATTYSLDLKALLAVPVALCNGRELSEDHQEKASFEIIAALSRVKSRLRVFYQQGNIHVPGRWNPAYSLLESCLVPVIPWPDAGKQGAFSAFHPKIWLLRFTSDQPRQPVRFRLLVMSRNLTLDGSMDLAVKLEGEGAGGAQNAENRPLRDFVAGLLKLAPLPDQQQLLRELGTVKWKTPAGFSSLAFMPTLPAHGLTASPVALVGNYDHLLVMSPFIRNGRSNIDALNKLAASCTDGKRYLFSNARELDAIGAEKLDGWQCYSLSEAAIGALERQELDDNGAGNQPFNLHAKLVVAQRGKSSRWHLGSANATNAALGDGLQRPRNSEFMLQLNGSSQAIGIDKLLPQLLEGGLFTEHKMSPWQEECDDAGLEQALRLLCWNLTRESWRLNVTSCPAGYALQLQLPTVNVGAQFKVEVSLPLGGAQSWQHQLSWHANSLLDIATLFVLTIKASYADGSPWRKISRLVQAEWIDGAELLAARESALMSQLIGDEKKFFHYLSCLLDTRHQPSFSAPGDNMSGAQTEGGISLFNSGEPLYEKLLDAAARQPQILLQIDRLVQQFADRPNIIPPVFVAMWQYFSPARSTL